MKITITMDDRLLERIDKFADDNYMSRSGFISIASTQYLNQNEFISVVRSIGSVMKKIADTGNVDEAMIKELNMYTEMIKLLAE